MPKYELISFVLSEAKKLNPGKTVVAKSTQSAPPYFSEAVPKQTLINEEEITLDNKKIGVFIKSYKPGILLIEARVVVDNPFSNDAFDLRDKLIDTLNKVSKKYGGDLKFSEEYSLMTVSQYDGDAEQFLKYSEKIAGFLKSEKAKLDQKEIEHTINTYQIKYADNDLVIIDWDGAFIFEPKEDIGSIVELFEIANLQLLRYRILDDDLSDRLDTVTKLVSEPKEGMLQMLFTQRKISDAFKEVIGVRTKSIKEFKFIEKEIKLIGDWYLARLYRLLSTKFRFNEWKEDVTEKLDSIEDIYTIIENNFSLSRNEFLEFIQIILFFVLQIGWFILIILEFFYFTRK